jgi:hypothetical protein
MSYETVQLVQKFKEEIPIQHGVVHTSLHLQEDIPIQHVVHTSLHLQKTEKQMEF